MTSHQTQERQGEAEISVLDCCLVIWRRRKFIVSMCTLALLSSLLFSLISTKRYASTVVIIGPNESRSTMAPSLGMLSEQLGLQLPSGRPKLNQIVNVLKSRTLAETLVEQYDLANYYRTFDAYRAVAELQNFTEIDVSEDGVVSLTVEDRDPRMAAELANAYPEQLNRLLVQLDTSAASRERRFVAEQLAATERSLRRAEENLMRFQEQNRTVSLEEQARGAIEVAARLKGEIVASEVHLQVLRNFATESNPEVISLNRKIKELKNQLAEAQYGSDIELPSASTSDAVQKEFYLPAVQFPKVGIELARLMREVKVHEAVFTLLTQQLEQSKIGEARNIPTALVLDRALPAPRKVKPKTVLNMALSLLASLIVAVMLAFIMEYIEQQKQSFRYRLAAAP